MHTNYIGIIILIQCISANLSYLDEKHNNRCPSEPNRSLSSIYARPFFLSVLTYDKI